MSKLALSLCLGLIAVACGTTTGVEGPSPSTRGTIKPSVCASAPPLQATIRITSPKAGDTMPPGDVTVAFEVTGADLVAIFRAVCANDYHVHVALDRDVAAYLGTDLPAPPGDIKHTPGTTNDEPRSVTFSGVGPGQHTAIAWISRADHASVKPPVSFAVTFTVR